MSRVALGILRAVLILIAVTMTALTIHVSLLQSLWDVLPRMIHDPWTFATFVDFYFNLLLISAWMAYKEQSWLSRVVWFALFIGMGSIMTSFYMLWQTRGLRPGDSIRRLLLRAEDC